MLNGVLGMRRELFQLLEKRNKISYQLIELFQIENSWLEVKKISSELDISNRSAQRYIHYLEELVNEYNDEKQKSLIMHYEKFKGIKFDFSDSSIEQFKLYIFCNDQNMRLLLDLCLLKTEPIKKYSQKHFISIYAIKNALIEIEPLLTSFDLKVDSKKLTLVGEEKTIRIFIYNILWSIYKNDCWPFHYIDEQRLYQSIDTIEQELDLTFSNIQRKQISYFMAICLIRNRKKLYIDHYPEWEKYVNIKSLSSKEEILIKGMRHYQIFDSNEILFILMIMETKHRMYKSDKIKKRVLKYHKKNDTDIYRLTNQMIDKFEQEFFSIPPESLELVYTYCFCTHLQSKIFPNVPLDADGYGTFENTDALQHLNNKILKFIREMKHEENETILAQEAFLVKKYLALFSYFGRLTDYEPQINVVIDSDLPFLVQEDLKRRLRGQFDKYFNLQMSETIPKDRDNYLVITTMPSLKNTVETICVVDPPLFYRDYQMIEEILTYKLQQLYQDTMNRTNHQSIKVNNNEVLAIS